MRFLPTLPARLLANSLTDPETRGEWQREFSYGGLAATYRNASRDLTLTRGFSNGSVSLLCTPFDLSRADKVIVESAIKVFEQHLKDQREAEALNRLTAPRKRAKPERRKP